MLYTKNSVLTAISSISDISASVSAIINAIKSSDGISAFVSAMENASIELPKIGSQLMGAKKTIAPIVEQIKSLLDELKAAEEGIAPLIASAKETEESARKVESLFAQLMGLGMNPSSAQLESLEDLKAERIALEAQIADLSIKKKELEEAVASFSTTKAKITPTPKAEKPTTSSVSFENAEEAPIQEEIIPVLEGDGIIKLTKLGRAYIECAEKQYDVRLDDKYLTDFKEGDEVHFVAPVKRQAKVNNNGNTIIYAKECILADKFYGKLEKKKETKKETKKGNELFKPIGSKTLESGSGLGGKSLAEQLAAFC